MLDEVAQLQNTSTPQQLGDASGELAAAANAARDGDVGMSLDNLGVPPAIAIEKKEELDAWVQQCTAHAERYVRTFEEPATASLLADIFKAPSVFGAFQPGNNEEKVAVLFDAKTCGESSSQPWLRRPAMSFERLKKVVKASITARLGEERT